MNIGTILTSAAAQFGDRPGIRFGEATTSYRAWNQRATAFAEALRARGIAPGDRVAILQQNGPVLLESLYGALKAGAVAVPINAKLHHEEYAFIIAHSEAKAVVFSPDFAEGLAAVDDRLPAGIWRVSTMVCAAPGIDLFGEVVASHPGVAADVDRGGDDVCWLFYTSGTTGRPKGAMVTHGNLAFMSEQYAREVRSVEPGESCIHAAPLTHAGGLWSLPLTAAGALHVIPDPPQFDPVRILRLVESEEARQIVFLAPTMLTMLLDACDQLDSSPGACPDVSSLQLIGYGGSPAYTSELRRAIARFGPVLCQIYGQGECPMTITMLAPEQHLDPDPAVEARRLTSAGTVRDGIEVEILDESDGPVVAGETGEVCVRGPVVMRGYWNDDRASGEAFRSGWYHTGDLGRRDSDGYVYLLDRMKDLIITGGSNVYGREVEDVLLRHPDVEEVAVIGLPDAKWGELVVAVIVAGEREPKPEELAHLCEQQLAGFKKPRRWIFVSELPKNGYGKVLKRDLRTAYAGT